MKMVYNINIIKVKETTLKIPNKLNFGGKKKKKNLKRLLWIYGKKNL